MAQRPTVIVGTSVVRRRRQQWWGDTHLAREIGKSLASFGWSVRYVRYGQLHLLRKRPRSVVLYLRGIRPSPRVRMPLATWLISHPASLTPDELARNDLLFSASRALATQLSGTYLPQATSASRFTPSDGPDHDLLFIGNSRSERRSSVAHALRAQLPITVFGQGWGTVFPNLQVAGPGVPNDELGAYYANAKVVLNDHWPDMAAAGIVSNRVYDVLASGGQLLTDSVADLPQSLASHLTIYRSHDEYVAGVHKLRSMSLIERSERANASREFILTRHTFDHRAEVLDAQLRELIEQT